MITTKFRVGQRVKFLDKEGTVFIVDKHGTFEDNTQPSYDILSDGVLYKHIKQSSITEKE